MQPDDADAIIDTATIDAAIDAAIDAMPDARMCPAAPPNCTLFKCSGSTSCYYTCGSSTSTTGRRSWTSARDTCVSSAIGCLVTINNQAEQDCVAQQAAPVFPNVVWFGLRQSASGNEPDGGWAWECPPSMYAPAAWGGTEPNDQGGDEDCGSMTTNGGWNDATCSDQTRYVCELP
jgi:hypothetical protein